MDRGNTALQGDNLANFRAHADKILVAALGLHLLVNLITGFLTNTVSLALLIGGPAFLVPLVLSRLEKGALVTRLAVACAFMVFSMLLIQQTSGTIEAHFGIFVLLAFLMLYCDLWPLIAAAGLIAVHHVAFAWLQYNGSAVYIFPDQASLMRVVVHAAYVVVETGLLCYIAVQLKGMVEDGVIVSNFARHVSSGHLDFPFERNRIEQRPVLNAVAQMQDELRVMLADVGRTSANLRQLAGRFSQASSEISSGATEQGESTTAMAAAIQEMTVAITHITDNAASAQNLSQQSREAANSGNSVVRQAMDEMADIANLIQTAADQVSALGERSEQASQVVQIIKEIADQTNLLALNAAIEAARAGEMGRGFAVVADEVRKLAERTTASTDEIAAMMNEMRSATDSVLGCISNTVDKVASGVANAEKAVATIDGITGSVDGVGDVVSSISGALLEQNSAAHEIARHVEQITSKAEQSVSATAAIASEARMLEQEADSLRNTLARFSV